MPCGCLAPAHLPGCCWGAGTAASILGGTPQSPRRQACETKEEGLQGFYGGLFCLQQIPGHDFTIPGFQAPLAPYPTPGREGLGFPQQVGRLVRPRGAVGKLDGGALGSRGSPSVESQVRPLQPASSRPPRAPFVLHHSPGLGPH